MTPAESLAALEAFAAARGVRLSGCTPRAGLEQMLAFYESVPADGCAGPDADMLLFQWGTYDWGEGRHFELNLTRQFIEQDGDGDDDADEDDDAMSQLGLTWRFAPAPGDETLGEGNRWCTGRDGLADFRQFVLSSPPWAALADRPAVSVDLSYSCV